MRRERKETRGTNGPAGERSWWVMLRKTQAAQLVEFAMVLPLLLVMAVGITDFGRAYALKQRLTNAAREGARIASGQTRADLTSTSCSTTGASSPCTIDAVRNAVDQYLVNAGVADCGLNSATPTTGPSAFTWTYSSSAGCPGTLALTIQREMPIPPGCGALGNPCILASRVTLNYPFRWSFSRVIRLLVQSANYPSSFTISTAVVMKDL